jgi:hypothetical protein
MKEEHLGSGLLESARKSLFGRPQQIDEAEDEAMGSKPRKKKKSYDDDEETE